MSTSTYKWKGITATTLRTFIGRDLKEYDVSQGTEIELSQDEANFLLGFPRIKMFLKQVKQSEKEFDKASVKIVEEKQKEDQKQHEEQLDKLINNPNIESLQVNGKEIKAKEQGKGNKGK